MEITLNISEFKTETYQQIYLYAKNKYIRGNIINDIRCIFAYTENMDRKLLTANLMGNMLIKITFQIICFSLPLESNFERFINNLNPSKCWRTGYFIKEKYPTLDYTEPYDFQKALFHSCLNIISTNKNKHPMYEDAEPNSEILNIK